MTEYIKNPLSGKLRGVTYEDGKIIDVHIRDEDDVVKVFVPVRHGRWIKESDGGTRCSVCNKRVRDVTGGWDEPVDLSDMPYCPKCGARMNEDEV